MVWYAWALLAWCAVTAVLQVWLVGRYRKPKTPGEAVISLVELGVVSWAIVALAT